MDKNKPHEGNSMKKRFFVILFFVVGTLSITGAPILWAQDKSVAENQTQEGLKARCSTDADCNRPGMIGVCQAPGEKISRCLWQEIVKVPAIVIEPQECRSCQTSGVVNQLRMFFPGLEVEYLKASDQKAKELIDQIKIDMLPAYIFTKEVERESSFADFQKMAILVDGKYYLKPEFSGVSFFLNRKTEKNKLDLFLVLTSPGMYQSAKIAQDIGKNKKDNMAVKVHFLGLEDAKTRKIISPGSDREAAEEKVYACVEKYYPEQSWDYLIERLMNASDIWIEDGLQTRKFDVNKVKSCAKGSEGEKLLKEKIRLSQELNVRYAPLFLMENTEIFGAGEKTTVDEVLKMIKGGKEIKQ
jgi:hypothetical protein